MHVILLTSSGNKSGGSRQALYLAQGLEERGHTVAFVTPAKATLRGLAPDWPGWNPAGKKESLARAVLRAMPAPGTPCVVHAFHNKAVKQAALWGLLWRNRAVTVAHRGVIYRPNNPLPYWSPGIDAFLVNSAACAQVLRSIGVSGKRLFVVPNSVPDQRLLPRPSRTDARAFLGLAEDELVFGAISGDDAVKGVEVLIRAFALALEGRASGMPGMRLVIMGADSPVWPALSRDLGITSRVSFVPHGNAIAPTLAALDVYVLPSLAESMPNTLLEAVRFGLPAIGTRVGAVPEILESCGILIPPSDSRALADAMLTLAGNPRQIARLAGEALLTGSIYAPEKRLALVETIYTDLLRRKGLMP